MVSGDGDWIWDDRSSTILSSPKSNVLEPSVLLLSDQSHSQRAMESLTLTLALHRALCSSAWSGPVKTECGRMSTSSNALKPRKGKVSRKRRSSRAASKSPITFLAADAANFRAMVQQVTGFPFNGGGVVPHPTTRPPPSSSHPINNILEGLPTLDTSALLIDSAMLTGRAPGPLVNLSAHFPNVDPLAKSPSMKPQLLRQSLKAKRSMPPSVHQTKSIHFLPAENDHPDSPRCSMIPSAMHDNDILLDSWFSTDAMINSS